jgi:cellulose synthase (UDP-forming)
MEELYFTKFESRIPHQPLERSNLRSFLFKIFAVLTLAAGTYYMLWRWTQTINYDIAFYSVPLAVAETLSLFGIFLYFFDMWYGRNLTIKAPPIHLSEIQRADKDRMISIDIFITTINEEADLLRYTIRDAKALRLPDPEMKLNIYMLDDGRRDGRKPGENIKALCEEEGIGYITRETNKGYKAGNLNNALQYSSGDIFVILDADARPFPDMLLHTLGYFRQPHVAWVQTSHWFYDTTEEMPLHQYLCHLLRIRSPLAISILKKLFGRIKTGKDIYGSDPRPFYEILLRGRNYHKAAFCCGAGSVHRRKALLECAEERRRNRCSQLLKEYARKNPHATPQMLSLQEKLILSEEELSPFIHHISEDLYTSMVLQCSSAGWHGVLHPQVECKLLSPQDLGTFVKQRARYAEGAISIFLGDNPLLKKGLTWQQKICYFHSVWTYFGGIWTLLFLFSPITYFYAGLVPVSCETSAFLTHFCAFYFLFRISDTVASGGISQKRGRQYYVCLFWINIRAVFKMMFIRKTSFNVTPKKRQQSGALKHIWPHLAIIVLTLGGTAYRLEEVYMGAEHMSLALAMNCGWGLYNVYLLNVFVRAAYWSPSMTAPVESEAPRVIQTSPQISELENV